ncbi:gliding motility-associated C-terminal domain-containing protein [Winogradskyella forsetii]|uniref:T9SS type B sorting domain-containing protein n=1 Tax=Winogradskyella forsetii TaxID=2686077 RepID=UPI0015BB0911|nr:gliding motility-associated C-terminal domain-containing protein [Winogradskyella forsetii]
MKKLKNLTICIPILLLAFTMTSCGDDEQTPEEVDVFLGCCSEEPVFGANVDNLDQSVNGEISMADIITPNGDGINDYFGVINIQNYDNHTVTIYTSDDQVVFESNDYFGFNNIFPDGEQTQTGMANYPDGTYKYKIVIENEETFFKSGTFCLYTDNPPLEEQNFSECIEPGDPLDPFLTGN